MEIIGGSNSGKRIKDSGELLTEAGIEWPVSVPELNLGLIKNKSKSWYPYPPYYTQTRVPIPQYSSNLEEFENEPYKDYEPLICHSADFPEPDNLSDYDDDNVVVPEGLDPVYYKKTRRDSVALDRFLAIMRRKRDEARPEDPSEIELYYAGTGTPMPVSDQAFQLNWATPSTSERRADDYGADFTIFVGNLARDVTDYVLQETFRAHYTSVKSANVVTDRITGFSKGYGFVRFMDEAERARAMVEMNGAFCSSRPMRIGPAATKKPVGCQQYYEKVPYQSAQDPNMHCLGYPGYGSYQQAHQDNDGYGCTAPPQGPNIYSLGYPDHGNYQQPYQCVLPHP